MELRAGYKKIEGRIIPNDWDMYTVNDLITFEGGSQPDKSTFVFSARNGYVRLIQIRDYKSDKYETYVPINLARKFCTQEDIMIGRYGPPIFQILKGIEGAYNVALIKATPKSKLSNLYAYFFLKQDSLFSFVEKLSQRSSGQTGIDLNELKGYPLPLPKSYAEQTAIANALSDADALIGSLQKLIAKKRQIKQGTMQTLLNPYENGMLKAGWAVRELGDIADILTGHPFPSDGYAKSGIRLLRGSNIKRGVTDWSDEISQYWPSLTTDIRKYALEKGDIVIAMDGSLVGKSFAQISENDLPAILLQRVARIRPKNSNVDVNYIKEWICSEMFTSHCDSLKTVTAIPHISPGDIRSFKINMPFDLFDQERIASILSDMDAEIAALETKLAKYQQIKQGMMQNLLTGRIRLV